ncbi:MAG: hypothetical protein Q8K86_09135, partial [Candidatus Nanopelagicaceae bacterium]|nr:hypothetical protein [Candidatus Nanopelagicaceae bacterium]
MNVSTLLATPLLDISGKLNSTYVGTSTFAGGIKANLLSSDTQLVLSGLTSCDTLDTDANGVVKCGTDATGGNTSGFTDTGSVVRLVTASDNVELGDLFVLGSDLNIGNGKVATSTLFGEYGKLGLGSTTPWGQFSIEVSDVPGSTTPAFVIGDSGTSSPIFIANVNGRIGIATNTVDQYGLLGIGFSVATNTYVSGGLSVGRSATTSSGSVQALAIDGTTLNLSSRIDSIFSGTNTFSGAISASQLNFTGLTVGDILSSGKITATGAATSSIPQLVNATLLAPASLYVSGVSTSSFEGGINVKGIGGITSASGLNISGGDILSSGRLTISSTATSTIPNLSSTLINSSQLVLSGKLSSSFAGTNTFDGAANFAAINLTTGGLNMSGDLLTGGKIVSSGSATNTLPNVNVSTLLATPLLDISGKLNSTYIGTSTFAGGIKANLLSSDTQLVLSGLPSCDSIDTDANGVVKCGTDADTVTPNTSGFTDTGTIVRLQTASDNVELGDLFVLGSDINIGNGILATSTISGQYGKLGFATTAPFGQVAIEVDGTIVGSTTPVFVIGDSGTSSPLFEINAVGQIG